MKKRILALAITGVVMSVSLAGCGSTNTKSDSWAKNVEIQVPAKAGGGTDVMARALSAKVAKDSGSALTIVNNTDGSGVVACEKVATSKKDGSTLVYWHTAMLIKTSMGVYNKSASNDFTVIGVAVPKEQANNVLVVSADSDYQTLDELIAAAKEKPGELLFGVETGGVIHIETGLLSKAAGIEVKYVEAGSDTEKLTALVGHSIDACLVNANQAKQYIESGKARALAVVSNTKDGGRNSVLPDIKSFIEQGVDLHFQMYNALILGPKNMDPALAEKIHDYYKTAAQDEEVNKTLKPAGFEMEFLDYADGAKNVVETQTMIDGVVKDLGLDK